VKGWDEHHWMGISCGRALVHVVWAWFETINHRPKMKYKPCGEDVDGFEGTVDIGTAGRLLALCDIWYIQEKNCPEHYRTLL
jgi:hypothetical protein